MIWRFGTICEVDEHNRALVKVAIHNRVTPLLPVMMTANAFKKAWSPPKIGEQVVVLGDEHNDGVVIPGSIYHQQLKEPTGASANTDIVEYSDGSRVEYNSATHQLKIRINGKVDMTCTAAKVKADAVVIDSARIDLGGTGGKGVVTGDCICPYTGNTHGDVSAIVFANK